MISQTQGLVIVGGFEAFQAALQVLDSNIQTYKNPTDKIFYHFQHLAVMEKK